MKSVCLLSGGLDSATALYAVRQEGHATAALSVGYGQRHVRELECAKAMTQALGVPHHVLSLELPWKGSALLEPGIKLPADRVETAMAREIPSTYVPARNSILLALAFSMAESLRAECLVIGANVLDYSGYPDCRPEFLAAYEAALQKGTKAGVSGHPIRVRAPLLHLDKADIIRLGVSLGVPFEQTWSCYEGGQKPCGHCDACILRAKGFREAGIRDPLEGRQPAGDVCLVPDADA